jgi:hypothetical protein
MPSGDAVAQVQGANRLGVQLYLDEYTYRLMFEALDRVLAAKGNRLAELRDIIHGSAPTRKFSFLPVRFPWLNPSQEAAVNEVIARNLDVTIEFMSREQAAAIVDLSKLPEDASETLRIVRVGDYDACACIGAHVKKTAEIGSFKILSHDYENGRWRVRWKVQ